MIRNEHVKIGDGYNICKTRNYTFIMDECHKGFYWVEIPFLIRYIKRKVFQAENCQRINSFMKKIV